MKFFFALMITLFVGSDCFAMFCPNNFNLINFGDTLKEVEKQCGKPTSEKIYKSIDNQPQEWDYFLTLNPGGQPGMTGTVKVTMVFVDNKLININSSGVNVTTTATCDGNTIQLGMSTGDVKKACGNPVFVTKANPEVLTDGNKMPTTMTEWTYEGSPTVVLIFENGKLKDKQ